MPEIGVHDPETGVHNRPKRVFTMGRNAQWTTRTQELIRQGMRGEEAGHQAASEIFATYQRYKYSGLPDTIYDLLTNLGKK